jgi:hypothetical protein
MLMTGTDGEHWRDVAPMLPEIGDETSFAFDSEGAITAIVRTNGAAFVCRSRPPYLEWQRDELGEKLGGPLLVDLGGRYLVGGRSTRDGKPVTRLFWLEGNRLVDALTLPSAGDNSYPGYVALEPDVGLLSYYSSHEGNTAVYLARLEHS